MGWSSMDLGLEWSWYWNESVEGIDARCGRSEAQALRDETRFSLQCAENNQASRRRHISSCCRSLRIYHAIVPSSRRSGIRKGGSSAVERSGLPFLRHDWMWVILQRDCRCLWSDSWYDSYDFPSRIPRVALFSPIDVNISRPAPLSTQRGESL